MPASPNTPDTRAVLAAAQALGRPITPDQAAGLALYLELLQKWNARTNLVGPRRWQEVMETLVVDSLYLADFLEGLGLDAPRCLDLGAGAGLPGIPLRMLWSRGSYTLVEVREKRAVFMTMVLNRLKLASTDVFRGRAEDVLSKGDRADLILSRAFMPWPRLLKFALPMLAPDGRLVVMANEKPPSPEEISSGWRLVGHSSYPVAGKERYFWVLVPAG